MSGGIQADVGQGTLSARRAGPLMVIEQGDVTAASDDVTVHLGGEEATGAAGTLTPGFGLAGEAGTGAAGTLGPEWSGALTGSAMTMAQGFVGTAQEAEDTFATSSTGSIASVEFDITASGTAATPAQGDLSVTNVVLVGQLALAQHYNIYPGIDKALVGAGMTMEQGVLAAEGGTPAVEIPATRLPRPITGGAGYRFEALRPMIANLLREDEELLILVYAFMEMQMALAEPEKEAA